jgi:hypothetical protein
MDGVIYVEHLTGVLSQETDVTGEQENHFTSVNIYLLHHHVKTSYV